MEKLHIAFQDGATNITADWLNAMQGNVNELIDLAQGEGATIYIKGKANNNAYGSVSVFASKDMHCDTYPAKANEYVTLKANPASGYMFTAWSDGDTRNPRVVLATKDGENEFTANFTSGTVELAVICDPAQGTVSGGGTVELGENVTVAANSKLGYQFKEWQSADGTFLSDQQTYTFKAPNVDMTIKAVFVEAEIGEIYCNVNIPESKEEDADYPCMIIEDVNADNADTYKLLVDGVETPFNAEEGYKMKTACSVVVVASNSITGKTRQTSTVEFCFNANENKLQAYSNAKMYYSTTGEATTSSDFVEAGETLDLTADQYDILSDNKKFHIKKN